MKEFRRGDNYVVEFHEPDLVVMRSSGETSVEEMRFLQDTIAAIAQEHGRPRILSITTGEQTGMSREAREFAGKAKWQAKCWAVVSPNWAFRTLANMIARAQTTIGNIDYPTRMFATEEEARSWIETIK